MKKKLNLQKHLGLYEYKICKSWHDFRTVRMLESFFDIFLDPWQVVLDPSVDGRLAVATISVAVRDEANEVPRVRWNKKIKIN